MKNKKIWYVFLTGLLIMLFVLNISLGSVEISVSELVDIIFKGEEGVHRKIVMNIRLPRALAAILLGGALSVSGYLLQTFFANPIASPFVLGISHGAKMAVAFVMIYFIDNGLKVDSATMIIAAFIGSMISVLFILIISGKVTTVSTLIICGVMIGYICNAITDFLVTFADDSNIVNLHNWSLGSFSGITMENVKVIAVAVILGVILSMMISKPIGAYQLGESYAKSLGVNVSLLRVMLVVLSSILSSTVTAFAGPVSFVGIAVPHIVRNMFKTSKASTIIPASFLAGASFCLMCDLIARTVFAPTEMSISTITAVFGAPIVIVIMIKRNSGVK